MRSRIGPAAHLALVLPWAIGAFGLAAAAAGTPRPREGMALPPELATGALEMTVKARGRLVLPDVPVPVMLELGPWRVTDFARGRHAGAGARSDFGALRIGGGPSTQRYRFRVVSTAAPEEPPWTCACASETAGGAIAHARRGWGLVVPSGGHGRLACDLWRGESGGAWRLELHVRALPGWYLRCRARGRLTSGGRSLGILGSDRTTRGPSFATERLMGFVLTLDGRPIGAADLSGEGALFVAPDAPEELRAPLAAAGAALILFEDLTRTFDEP